jgi:proline iminopeptidase
MAYSLDDYAADIEALREHLGLERVGLLGFSHGGMVAMRHAAQHSDRLTHLILLDTAPVLDEESMARATAAMDRRRGEPWYDEVRRSIDAEEDPALDDATAPDDAAALAGLLGILPMYFHRWDDVAMAFAEPLKDATFHARVGAPWNAEQPHLDLRPELADVTTPTLVVVGDDDFICDVVAAREMADRIAGAQLAVIADAGHFPWVEQPAAFRAALAGFLGANS